MTDIYLKADHKIIEDLTIEEGYAGDRDDKGQVVGEGGCLFKTAKGKNLFLRWSEFSFYQDGRPATVARNAAAAKLARRKKPLKLATIIPAVVSMLAMETLAVRHTEDGTVPIPAGV